ncbi:hypothetical protein [Lysinibacillus sp. NPDC047702]
MQQHVYQWGNIENPTLIFLHASLYDLEVAPITVAGHSVATEIKKWIYC